MKSEKIIVTGSSGQLGTALYEISGQNDDLEWVFLGRSDLDITDSGKVDSFFQKNCDRRSVIINCAAYTDVERAEDEPEKAFRINRDGVSNLAKASEKYSCSLIHISTDFVFNGRKSLPYNEGDEPDPLSVYGKSKHEGELEVMSVKSNCMIIRTSWLYSATHNTFVKKVLARAENSDRINVVSDETGSPTSSDSFAADIVRIVTHIINADDFSTDIFHYCNTGHVSRYGFAQKIIDFAGKDTAVFPILSKDLGLKAKRPANSALCTGKISDRFGLKIKTWQEALKDTLAVM